MGTSTKIQYGWLHNHSEGAWGLHEPTYKSFSIEWLESILCHPLRWCHCHPDWWKFKQTCMPSGYLVTGNLYHVIKQSCSIQAYLIWLHFVRVPVPWDFVSWKYKYYFSETMANYAYQIWFYIKFLLEVVWTSFFPKKKKAE